MTSQNIDHQEDETYPELELEEFLFKAPLYETRSFTSEMLPRALFSDRSFSVDGFCVACNRESVFQPVGVSASDVKKLNFFSLHGSSVVRLSCQRDETHELHFSVHITSDIKQSQHQIGFVHSKFTCGKITKFGQLPSHGDLHVADLKKYGKVIEQADRQEIGRARGLASHGVSIGAFIYLRRVFERFIERAFVSLKPEISEVDFQKLRMSEKIDLLKEQLPPFVSENKSIYSVLSQGVHALTEAECAALYELMYESILMMLDQALERYERDARAKKLTTALQKIRNSA